MPESVVVRAGDTFSVFLASMDTIDRLRTKAHLYITSVDTSWLSVGTYLFTGTYTPGGLVSHILAWPEQKFVRYTVLEGWSIYDIDSDLTQKWFIQAGEYISYVSTVASLIDQYPFLQGIDTLKTLEGFLYPDTYFLDDNGSFVAQLVKAQLDNFQKRIWSLYSGNINSFSQQQWLDWYEIVTLASVVQKEERNIDNQPTVAGIFLRRLSIGMRLDADITLCYYYRKPYSDCTPWFIARSIGIEQPYNTRQVRGLPPTPIANIPVGAIQAVLSFAPSSYLYYLHDAQGRIRYAETLEQHNSNKARYLP